MVSLLGRAWLAVLFLASTVSPALAQPAWVQQNIATRTGSTGAATDVNNAGDIVGYGETGAFLWTRSDGMRDLGTLGGSSSIAYGVNDARQVVGHAQTAAGQFHAFIWTAATGMVDLGTLGGTFSRAKAINSRGEVVGEWAPTDTSHYRPFRWTAATGMVDLTTTLGTSEFTSLKDINDAGQIVGYDAQGVFIWTPGQGRTNLPGATTVSLALNNGGQVGGTRVANNRPFVWTAAGGFVDVPASSTAFTVGLDDAGLVALAYYPFGGAQTGVAVSSVGDTFVPLATASGDWRGFPSAISAAGVVGSTAAGPSFWCRAGRPTISGAAAAPAVLQPVNGQLVTVRVDYTATGRCGTTSNFLEVESSEPEDGNPDGLPDFIVVDTHTVRLRAEHRAQSNGRTYTIRIRANDEYGYSAMQTVTVSVPDSGGGAGMTGVNVTTNVSSPQPAGTSIVLSAAGSGGTPPYAYRFSVQQWSVGVWQVLCDWSTTSTCAWTPTLPGGYDIRVEARRAIFTSGVEVEAFTSHQVTSSSGGGGGGVMSGVSLSTSVAAPQPVSTSIVLSATGSGGTAPYSYRFWIQSWSTGVWEIVREWSTAASYTWMPSAAGGYNLAVEARSAGATAPEVQSAIGFSVTGGSGSVAVMTRVTLSASMHGPQPLGTTVTWTAVGSGGAAPYSYRFWLQPWDGAWEIERNWSPSATWAWLASSAGGYNVAVEARSSGASTAQVQDAQIFILSAP